MRNFAKRLFTRKKGMEALQAIILLAIALFVSKIIKSQGMTAATNTGQGVSKITEGVGQ